MSEPILNTIPADAKHTSVVIQWYQCLFDIDTWYFVVWVSTIPAIDYETRDFKYELLYNNGRTS